MAESRRTTESPVSLTDQEASQKRRDRQTLILFGVGMVLIVIGMIALSRFLSGN